MIDAKVLSEALVRDALRKEAEHVDWQKDYKANIFGVSSAGFCSEKELLSRRYMVRSQPTGKMLMGTITHRVLDELVGKECIFHRATHAGEGGRMIFEHRSELPLKWADGCEALGAGHMDAVYVRDDGEVWLWDFKTTERMTMAPDVREAYALQVNIYRGLWNREFPKTPITRAFLIKMNFQFKAGEWGDAVQAEEVEYDEHAMEVWTDRIHLIAKMLKDNGHALCTGRGWECKACHVRELCPSPDVRDVTPPAEVKRIA